jgi:hypothetical protein
MVLTDKSLCHVKPKLRTELRTVRTFRTARLSASRSPPHVPHLTFPFVRRYKSATASVLPEPLQNAAADEPAHSARNGGLMVGKRAHGRPQIEDITAWNHGSASKVREDLALQRTQGLNHGPSLSRCATMYRAARSQRTHLICR